MSAEDNKDQKESVLNPQASAFLQKWRSASADPQVIAEGLLRGDRIQLSRAITLVESEKEAHQEKAREVIRLCMPHSGRSFRIAITGSPGSGKSTFIEAFGQELLAQGHRPAVLAIDPSSSLSKGSILGDKTRMLTLSGHPEVFIRPSPAGESLGGVARKTRETIILCEAAGFDRILVETVGVGQSEHAVSSMTDFFLLILLPGAGDELQGIKRGIVEMADLVVVNKVDGERTALGKQTRQAYRNALHLMAPKENGWTPQVQTCSALLKEGISEIHQTIQEFHEQALQNSSFDRRRRHQAAHWFNESLLEQLKAFFFHHPAVKERLPVLLKEVEEGRQSPFSAAQELVAFIDS